MTEEITTKAAISHRQIAISIGLAGIAAVHILDLPGKWTEVRYLGVGYLLVILASFYLMERIVVHGKRNDFVASAALSVAVIVGYLVNRTVGMPGAMDDIGNWLEPLGLFSIFIELYVFWNAARALQNMKK